jgi:8-oxo-dGTP pyrophosphatase MutT (NUDIX family)
VEKGETEINAAKRELFEETGLQVNVEDLVEFPGNYVESTLNMKNGPEDFTFRVFYAKNYSGKIKSNDETEPKWIKLDEIDKYPLVLANVKEMINNCLKYIQW